MPLPTLTGQKVTLRQLTKRDAEDFWQLANDKQVARYLANLPHPYSLEDGYAFIRRTHRQTRNRTDFAFGIVPHDLGKVVGAAGFHQYDQRNRRIEVGYWLGRPYWRKGYASEAVLLACRWAFEDLRVNRIQARVVATNDASSNLLLKLGFQYEGTWRMAEQMRGRWHDIKWFGLLKKDFKQRT